MCEELYGEIHICNGPDRKIMPLSPPPKIVLANCGQRENLLSLHASYCIIHCLCILSIPSQASITLVYSFHKHLLNGYSELKLCEALRF